MEYQVIKKFQDELDIEIIKIKNENNSAAFVDGLIDIKKYLEAKTKIMWILKEPYSTEDDKNWREEIAGLRTESGVKNGWAGTFNPIIYTSYGILNNKDWNNISDTSSDPSIIDVLYSIAFINIKKTPGGSSSDDDELEAYHKTHKSILLKQIEVYNPDVIICGNTFQFIKDDLNINLETNEHFYDQTVDMSIYKNDKFIIVDAFHPNAHKNKQKYCDFIIENVNKWK